MSTVDEKIKKLNEKLESVKANFLYYKEKFMLYSKLVKENEKNISELEKPIAELEEKVNEMLKNENVEKFYNALTNMKTTFTNPILEHVTQVHKYKAIKDALLQSSVEVQEFNKVYQELTKHKNQMVGLKNALDKNNTEKQYWSGKLKESQQKQNEIVAEIKLHRENIFEK